MKQSKKLIKAGVCAALTGGLLVTSLGGNGTEVVMASSRMSGVQQVVDGISTADPFTILEIVPDMAYASFGYYVKGQEPEIAPELLAGCTSEEERKATVISLLSNIASTDDTKPLTYSEETIYQEQTEEPYDTTGWSVIENSLSGEKIYYKITLTNNDWFSAKVLELENSDAIEVVTLTAVDASSQIDSGELNLEEIDMLYLSASSALNIAESYAMTMPTYSIAIDGLSAANDITSNTEQRLYQYAKKDKMPVLLDADLIELSSASRIELLADLLKEHDEKISETNGVCCNVYFGEDIVSASLIDEVENPFLEEIEGPTEEGHVDELAAADEVQTTPETGGTDNGAAADGSEATEDSATDDSGDSEGILPETDETGKDTYGYSDVLNQIENEDLYNSENEKEFTTEYEEGEYNITFATLMKYAVNYASRQVVVAKESLRILDIEPAKYSTLTEKVVRSWFTDSTVLKTVTIDQMSTAEFIGKNVDLVETYDLIYIGSCVGDGAMEGSLNLYEDSTATNYNDAALFNRIYSNVGDLAAVPAEFEMVGSSKDTAGNITTRYSGNDINELKKKELIEYVKGGYPIVVSSELYLAETVEGEISGTKVTGQMYDFLSSYTAYDNVIHSGVLEATTFTEYINIPKIEVTLKATPTKNGITYLEDGTLDYHNALTSDTLNYTFSFTDDAKNEADYVVRLYVDKNDDGSFSDSEELTNLTVKSGTTQIAANSILPGNTYTLSAELTSEYQGYVSWKLEVEAIAKAAVAAVNEIDDTEAVSTVDNLTGAEETLDTEDVTGTEETPDTEDMTGTEETPDAEDVTGAEEAPAAEDETGTEETTDTEDVTGAEEAPDTENETGLGETGGSSIAEDSSEETDLSDGMQDRVDAMNDAADPSFSDEVNNVTEDEEGNVAELSAGNSSAVTENVLTARGSKTGEEYLTLDTEKFKVLQLEISPSGLSVGSNKEIKNLLDELKANGLYSIDVTERTQNTYLSDCSKYMAANPTATAKNFYENYFRGSEKYDMLIIGFADKYADSAVSEDDPNVISFAVQAMEEFVNSGRAVLFTHDTTSYKANTLSGNSNTWGYYLNRFVRKVTAQDRYGIVNTGVQNNPGAEGYSNVRLDLNSANELKSRVYTNLVDNTCAVSQVNTGQITSYPFNLELAENTRSAVANSLGTKGSYQKMSLTTELVGVTQAPNYQLDLERDANGDGVSDVTVWYTLADYGEGLGEKMLSGELSSPDDWAYVIDLVRDLYNYSELQIGSIQDAIKLLSSAYAASPNDVRNNYYIYSVGNVTYTGLGASKEVNEYEAKLFVNTLITAYEQGIKNPKVKVLEEVDGEESEVDKIFRTYDVELNSYSTEDEVLNYYVTDSNIVDGTKTIYVNVYYEVPTAISGSVEYIDSDGVTHYLVSVNSATLPHTFIGSEAEGTVILLSDFINNLFASQHEIAIYTGAQTVIQYESGKTIKTEWVYNKLTINKLTMFNLD